MGRRADRIRGRANISGHHDQRRSMERRGTFHRVEYHAEKNLGGEDTHRSHNRVFDLVLGRTAGLASSTSELVICCYSKSGIDPFHFTHHKIIVERGL